MPFEGRSKGGDFMIGRIYHVGLTVSDLDRSVAFYRDVLGLTYQGEMVMTGPATDALFQKKNCKVRLAYLNGSEHVETPPVELIQFVGEPSAKGAPDLFAPSISELCFYTDAIDAVYERLLEKGVDCLSPPVAFDFTDQGFGKSKAFYFKDPDGIILEMMQPL